jgi:hypothetical protein
MGGRAVADAASTFAYAALLTTARLQPVSSLWRVRLVCPIRPEHQHSRLQIQSSPCDEAVYLNIFAFFVNPHRVQNLKEKTCRR